MEKVITYENLRSFAYSNDRIVKKPVRGIVISFYGLGEMKTHSSDTREGEFYAENGILYVIPYYDPWCWMNAKAVSYTDEILDVLFDRYSLDADTPVVSTGRSMGGLSSLVYTVYAKRTPAACVANCPVCDAVYHYTERDDLPRTMYSALYDFNGTLEEGLRSISPLHLVNKMPKICYRLFHCDADRAVNIQKHSEVFVSKMKENGFDITLDVVRERGHCNLTLSAEKLFAEYVLEAVNKKIR